MAMKNKFITLKSIFWLCCAMTLNAENNTDKLTSKRLQMVNDQIVRRGITDSKVLAALRSVPRHLFVPDSMIKYAYTDGPLSIGYNQTISQPYIVAIMTELLELNGDERILEIGTGSGYQAAILAQIANQVYSIEIVPQLAKRAKDTLTQLGYTNIHLKTADGFYGWPEHAPFDGIILTAAPPKIPEPLIDQLKENGRIVVPEGDYYQELRVYTKRNGILKKKDIIPVRFVPMTGYIDESP